MAYIYIDTNVFLGFYQGATDRFAVFDELIDRADQVVLTQQTIEEFGRNRTACLFSLADKIRNTKYEIFTASIIKESDHFEDWASKKQDAENEAKKIAAQIDEWIVNDKSEPVYNKFMVLSSKANVFETNPEGIENAKLRKVLGNPPTSPDKYTIGDELIWETLLNFCKEDLVVVSRDKTFHANESILKKEYEQRTKKKLILITKNLGEGLKAIGSPSPKIVEQELIVQEYLSSSPIDTGICPKCGGSMGTTGFDGSDGDSAWWLYCPQCGHEEFP